MRSVATDSGFDFRVCARQMHVSPTTAHVSAQRLVIWQPTCVRRFLSHVDRPIAAVRASEQIPDEIRRVMHRAGIDFAGRSQAKGEVMAIELGDSGI